MKVKDKWEHRAAHMQVPVSSMEFKIISYLQTRLKTRMLLHEPICLEKTWPDSQFPMKKTVAYWDGPVHRGKRLERDEYLRGKLQSIGWNVLEYSFKNNSTRRAIEIGKAMLEALE